LQSRSVFPTLSRELVGYCQFRTAPYYLGRGYAAQTQLQNPITTEFIERNRRLGKWINENAIIRLYGIMSYYGFLEKIDQTLPGWREVDLMRRMRNAFTKTPLSYRPEKPDNVRLRAEVIEHFSLNRENSPEEEIPTPIDPVLQPIFKRYREYISAKRAAQNKRMEPTR
jgi:hypothetical protein